MNEQFLQATHTPIVEYQEARAVQSTELPDWLRVSYLDIQDRGIRYAYHIVSEEDVGQPDGIAFRYYGTSNWWWLICTFNGIINPLYDLKLGQRLKIPNLQETKLFLQSTKTSRVNDLRGDFVTV